DRISALGISRVALAASYHGARAATPLHPAHRVVDAPHAALYRPVREAAWARRELRPVGAARPESPDPFGAATAALVSGGIAVDAWVILAHSSQLGRARPELAVRNCFGDSYPYALCVANEEVRDLIALLAAEAVRDLPVSGLSLESCGQLGFAHNGLHEKTIGAYSQAAERVLSVCCCAGCRRDWTAAGADPGQVVAGLRQALDVAQNGAVGAAATMEVLLGAELAGLLLATRLGNQDRARAQVLAALRDVAPSARLTIHGQPDPWATGPSPAVTAGALADVDAVLVPAWIDSQTTRDAIGSARRLAPTGVGVGAYVTVLPPADPTTVVDHAAALVAAGADELHLYHLGLANQSQLDVLGRIARAAHWH
ncbi:MAG: hypothetical protein ABWZ98_02175, partial [Nakamurella sp.]